MGRSAYRPGSVENLVSRRERPLSDQRLWAGLARKLAVVRSAVLHRIGQLNPGMASTLEERNRRGRECRIGKGTDKDGDEVGHRRGLGEDGRSAVGAEVKRPHHATIQHALERVALALNADIIGPEARAAPERASRAPLAR